MSFIYEKPLDPAFGSLTENLTAGGVASLGDIAGAAYDNMVYVDNTFSSEAVMQEALERRLDAVERATGRRFDNPYDLQSEQFANTELGFEPVNVAAGIEDLQGQLAGLQKEFPNLSHIIRAEVPIADDAMKIGRDADERLGRFMASRSGFGKWGAVLAGGAPAILQDPVQFATLGLGAAPSAARTVGGRILQVAAQEFVINAAVEAVIQPAVQAHRKALGIESGLTEALQNIALAGGFGAIFGGSVQGAGEVLSTLLRSNGAPDLPDTVKRALDGDPQAMVEMLDPVRDNLAPEARGALEAIRQDMATQNLRRLVAPDNNPEHNVPRFNIFIASQEDRSLAMKGSFGVPGILRIEPAQRGGKINIGKDELIAMVARDFPDAQQLIAPTFAADLQNYRASRLPAADDPNMGIAMRAVETGESRPFLPDHAQVYRLAEETIPPMAAYEPAVPSQQSLLQFIANRGGIEDYKGELAAMDAHLHRVKSGRRKLPIVSRNGLTLDAMTEAAIEEGFFGRIDPNKPTQVGINDLLDLIDTELRGRPVYAQADADNPDALSASAARDMDMEAAISHYSQIIEMAGPGLPDEVIRRIDALMMEGDSLGNAIERAIMEMPEPDARAADEALPGWSEEELLVASRDAPPITDEIFEGPEPQTVRQAETETDAERLDIADDYEMPDPATGETRLASQVLAEANRDSELAQILEACRT